MQLKVFSNSKGNALYYMKSVRKKGSRTPTKEKVAFLGYEEDLRKQFEDPIEHFRQEAKRLTAASPSREKVSMEIDLEERYDLGSLQPGGPGAAMSDSLHSFGQLPLSVIYHELEIDQFIKNRRDSWGVKANLDSIFRLLVFGRVLFPGSKLSTWRRRDRLMLGNSRFSDDDIYRSFPFLKRYASDLMVHMNERFTKKYKRDASLMFYDVTNLYSETDDPDPDVTDDKGEVTYGLRKRGCSKEHRPEPIVQIGLFMDREGIPVSFGLFPGNNNDVTTFQPMIRDVNEKLGLNRMIYVADKGMMSGTNVAHILAQRQGYIISDSVRKQDKDTVGYILDDAGYHYTSGMVANRQIQEEDRLLSYYEIPRKASDTDEAGETEAVLYKYKSRLIPSTEKAWVMDGTEKAEVCVNKRQIVFWSRKYQVRARLDRAEAIRKADRNGSVFNGHAANKYFQKVAYDQKTGELRKGIDHFRYLDKELIAKDEALDGYYLIETNVIGTCAGEKPWEGAARFRDSDMLFELNRAVADQDIIDMYRQLWEIEQNFRITKFYLKARPMFVRKADSIWAHVLTCFVSLYILRILEKKKLGSAIPHTEMIESLRSAQLAEIKDGIFKNLYFDENIQRIGHFTGLDMSKVFYTKQKLRSMNNQTKNID